MVALAGARRIPLHFVQLVAVAYGDGNSPTGRHRIGRYLGSSTEPVTDVCRRHTKSTGRCKDGWQYNFLGRRSAAGAESSEEDAEVGRHRPITGHRVQTETDP